MIAESILEFRRYRMQCEKALASVADDQFFQRPAPAVNPLALIVKHLAGNLRSRWTDFLTTDGEKPDRNRDQEFELNPTDTRAALMAAWERGWEALFGTLAALGEADLGRTVAIRGEPHTVAQALLRSVNHAAYHAGQIMYVSRMLSPDAPWLTIAPGQSAAHRPGYLGGQPK
jgi:uncharacterized damage-inducible protein DinB